MRNLWYGNSKNLDLAVMKADALKHSIGDNRHRPEKAVVHHHLFGTHCDGELHNVFINGETHDHVGQVKGMGR
jgi:hypothetical protein